MSTVHHAAAVVGCRVQKSKLFFDEEVRSCKHTLPRVGAKFCPDCGKTLWKKVENPHPEYNLDDQTLCGFKVFSNDCDDFVVVSFEHTETSDCDTNPPDILFVDGIQHNILRENLELRLEPLGLWNEEQFGIHVVLWHTQYLDIKPRIRGLC